MKTSEAWALIAAAYLKRAAGDVLTESERRIAWDGLCNARWRVPGTLTREQYELIGGDIAAAVAARNTELGVSGMQAHAYLHGSRGVVGSNLRGTLALLHAEAAKAEEARFATSPDAFVMAGAL